MKPAFWGDDANVAKANGFNKAQFPNVKKMMAGLKVTRYDANKEVAPGITSIFTPGHTPGHMSFVVASGAKKMLVQSDVSNVPVAVHASIRPGRPSSTTIRPRPSRRARSSTTWRRRRR